MRRAARIFRYAQKARDNPVYRGLTQGAHNTEELPQNCRTVDDTMRHGFCH